MGAVYQKAAPNHVGRRFAINIANIIAWINRKRGLKLSSGYYSNITLWESWWRGYVRDFHRFREVRGTGTVERELYSLKMAKKVCEDWASILLNDKTEIVVDDKTSGDFLLGSDGTGGILGTLHFWREGNALVEKAFYSGTGAFVLKIAGMRAKEGIIEPDPASKIRLNYLPADCIIPLTIRAGTITEAAFASEVLEKGEPYIYLEIHELDADGKYIIGNHYFSVKDNVLAERPLPDGILPELHTHSPYPLFAIITPNIVNNIAGGNGLGVSVYANAIDNLKGVDLAYNNFNRDFLLGGKKMFYNKSLIREVQDSDGNLVRIAPDDVMQQLFLQVGDDDASLDAKDLITEFNPSLRVQENRDGIQAQLDYLSFKVGLGTKHYQFNAGSVVTATQYMGDKQELVQNASKHYIIIEAALQQIVRAILWAGKMVLGQPVNPEAEIAVKFSDSFIIDDDTKRMQDKEDVRDGIMQRWEYRMKWYSEDEATARARAGEDSGLSFGDDGGGA